MNDVWPLRKLGRAEHWGRTLESALEDVEARFLRASQSVGGSNRYVASSSDSLSSLIQSTSALTTEIEQAILATPKYFIRSASASGFAVGNWGTIARVTIPAVAGFPRGEISAIGTVYTEQDATPVTSFDWPFPTSSVTSEYGPRPPLPFHNGIDFGQPMGTPIPSSSAGVVIRNAYYEDYGNYLRIDVSNETGVPNSWLGYAHMQFPSPLSVGTTVTQGQTLGLVGTTGFSTGPHLHWETAPGDDRIDPRMFMDIFGGGTSSTVLETQARILIGGSVSATFKPYAEVGIGPKQLEIPIHGRSLTGLTRGDSIQVDLQVRSLGGKLPAKSSNRATLSIEGGFAK